MRSEPIVEGSFARHTMDEVLGLVAISRQCLDVVFDDSQTGFLTVKAGQLLEAGAAGGEEGQAAFFTLYRRPGDRFAVYKRDRDVKNMKPLGQLAVLVEHAQRRPASRPPDKQAERQSPAPGPSAQAQPGQATPSPSQREMPQVTPTPQQAQGEGARTASGPAPERELIVQGRFADFPLNDVLATLSLTRQTVEFILRDGKEPRGGILLKAGQVLDARTKVPSNSPKEAFADLINNPGESFAIVRRASTPTTRSLGSLAEWISDVRRVVPMPVRRVVLDGMLSQFPILDVFSVLSSSRQRMVLELWDNGRPRARMVVKAGMVLEASTADQKMGEAAVRAILQAPGDRFVVASEPSRNHGQPLGRLIELVEAAQEEEGLSEPGEAPQPVPAPAPAPKTSTASPSSLPSYPSPTTGTGTDQASEQLLLEGSFSDFTLLDVFSVMGLSRHCLELRIKPSYGPPTGAIIRVKAGQVLFAALDGERDPVRVFHKLLTAPGKSFSIMRMPTPPSPISLGTLEALFREAQSLEDAAATVIDLEAQDPSLRDAHTAIRRRVTRESLENGGAPPGQHRVVEDRPTLIPPQLPPAPSAVSDARIEALTQQLEALERYVMDSRVETELKEAVALLQVLEKRVEELAAFDATRATSRSAGDTWLTILVILVQLFTLLAVVAAVGLSVIPWNL